jgi:hypothetical protein
VTDEEINAIAEMMRNGAIKICDEALSKWMAPDYFRGLEDMQQQRKMFFSRLKGKVPSVAAIKAFLREYAKANYGGDGSANR